MQKKDSKDFPTDDARNYSQTQLYIRDKYKIRGNYRARNLDYEFADKFLIYRKDEMTKLCSFKGWADYPADFAKNFDNPKIPKELKEWAREAMIEPDPFNLKEVFSNSTGLMYFLPLFTDERAIKVWKSMLAISKEKTLKFFNRLIALPRILSALYAESRSTHYQIAVNYQLALENLLKEIYAGQWLFDTKSPDSFSVCVNKYKIDQFDDAETRPVREYHYDFINRLEKYYEKLSDVIAVMEKLRPPKMMHERLMLDRTNKKATPHNLWARYITDIMKEFFGKPKTGFAKDFINVLFGTKDKVFTGADIKNIVRKKV